MQRGSSSDFCLLFAGETTLYSIDIIANSAARGSSSNEDIPENKDVFRRGRHQVLSA